MEATQKLIYHRFHSFLLVSSNTINMYKKIYKEKKENKLLLLIKYEWTVNFCCLPKRNGKKQYHKQSRKKISWLIFSYEIVLRSLLENVIISQFLQALKFIFCSFVNNLVKRRNNNLKVFYLLFPLVTIKLCMEWR